MSSLVFRKASSALHTIRSGSTANAQANEKVNDTYGHGILSFVVLGEDRLWGGELDTEDGKVAAHDSTNRGGRKNIEESSLKTNTRG